MVIALRCSYYLMERLGGIACYDLADIIGLGFIVFFIWIAVKYKPLKGGKKHG